MSKSDSLYHHGVLGMKWGRRKTRASSSSRNGAKTKAMSSKKMHAMVKKGSDFIHDNKSTIMRVGVAAASVGAVAIAGPYVGSLMSSLGSQLVPNVPKYPSPLDIPDDWHVTYNVQPIRPNKPLHTVYNSPIAWGKSH